MRYRAVMFLIVLTITAAGAAETVPPGRKAVLAEYSKRFDRIVFIRRNTCTADHYYTDHINDLSKPGGSLCVLNLRTGLVNELTPELKGGWFGRFDISFDARTVVFGWKKARKEGYRIYEIDIDPATGRRATSGGLRQLTHPPADEATLVKKYGKSRGGVYYHHGTDDMHPCYLPDGGIVFSSTRCQFGVLCNNDDVFSSMILHRMDSGGKNIEKLTNSAVSESSPCVLDDGRILYTRWEYVEKGHIGAKCLWAMKPDGSGSVEIYGNDITYPPSFMYGRPIPGSATQYVFLGTPHCFPNSIGTVIRIDTSKPIRTREPMTYMTPQVDVRTEKGYWYRQPDGGWKQDSKGTGPLFKDPYPLSDKLFLVSHKPAGPQWSDPKAYRLCLLDDKGAVRLIHKDDELSCWQPYPLQVRRKPPMLKTAFDGKLETPRRVRQIRQAACRAVERYEHRLEGPMGDRAGRVRRVGALCSAGRSEHLLPGARRQPLGRANRAELRELPSRRDAIVHRMPRNAEQRCGGAVRRGGQGSQAAAFGPGSTAGRQVRPQDAALSDRRPARARQTLRNVSQPEAAEESLRRDGPEWGSNGAFFKVVRSDSQQDRQVVGAGQRERQADGRIHSRQVVFFVRHNGDCDALQGQDQPAGQGSGRQSRQARRRTQRGQDHPAGTPEDQQLDRGQLPVLRIVLGPAPRAIQEQPGFPPGGHVRAGDQHNASDDRG